jgi:glycosyltransferase involved in cell wall biosynthesis
METKPSLKLKIALVTDAWAPQVNGVVRTLKATIKELERSGHQIEVIEPSTFKTLPCPTYPEIRLSLGAHRQIQNRLDAFAPDHMHVATEGPLGLAARRYCVSQQLNFTTSFHTRFPDYIHMRFKAPKAWVYAWLRWFHAPASSTLVATPNLMSDLHNRGFGPLSLWSRGVDVDLFYPREHKTLSFERPLWLYVGRVAIEKNIKGFLDIELPGTKIVVGDGPQRKALEAAYPKVQFCGTQTGNALAQYYSEGDVLVFPSKTDTFGLSILEALACGTPVAGFPVMGPQDVLGQMMGATALGALDQNLEQACLQSLKAGKPEQCIEHAKTFSWASAGEQFLSALVPLKQNSHEVRHSPIRSHPNHGDAKP